MKPITLTPLTQDPALTLEALHKTLTNVGEGGPEGRLEEVQIWGDTLTKLDIKIQRLTPVIEIQASR